MFFLIVFLPGSVVGKLEKENYLNKDLNNFLFVFEDLNFFTVQLLFKSFNIKISGGSINKHQFLSTTQYTLSKYLMTLDYNLVDIYINNIIIQ